MVWFFLQKYLVLKNKETGIKWDKRTITLATEKSTEDRTSDQVNVIHPTTAFKKKSWLPSKPHLETNLLQKWTFFKLTAPLKLVKKWNVLEDINLKLGNKIKAKVETILTNEDDSNNPS